MQAHEIFLVRHGAYDYGTGSLNDKGREQSRAALRELVALGAGSLALLLSSDAPRAIETSRIIAEGTGAEVVPSKRMRLSALEPDGVESLDECIQQSLNECGLLVPESLVVVAHEPLLQTAAYKSWANKPHFDNGAVLRYEPGSWENLAFLPDFAKMIESRMHE
ncbi:MAG: hypothetical protein JWO41_768 [Candidatus Saccharibacteria bacterium]|nr:hypothetical protein [Candidatus Saccharibacteria bacterium]